MPIVRQSGRDDGQAEDESQRALRPVDITLANLSILKNNHARRCAYHTGGYLQGVGLSAGRPAGIRAGVGRTPVGVAFGCLFFCYIQKNIIEIR